MTKKIVFVLALALVIVGIAAPSASAACNPPKFASTYNSLTGGFAYWHTTIVGGSLVGRMWSGATDYTGTCNTNPGSSFLYFGTDPQNVGMSVSLGDVCVPGCPAGSLSVKAAVTSADGTAQEFVATSTPETPAGGVNFDFSNSAHDMAATPRPRVGTNGGRSGGNVLLNTLAEPLGGYFEGTDAQVTSCNILSTGPAGSLTDPGRAAVAYPTVLATVPATGGSCAAAALTVNCSTIATDQWVVIQTVTAAGPDATVGPATRVKCNPALAQPKIKVNPKKAGVSNIRN